MASLGIVEEHLTEDLAALRAALSEICPPERAEAIVGNLLAVFRANCLPSRSN